MPDNLEPPQIPQYIPPYEQPEQKPPQIPQYIPPYEQPEQKPPSPQPVDGVEHIMIAGPGMVYGGENSNTIPENLPNGMFEILENLLMDEDALRCRYGASTMFIGTTQLAPSSGDPYFTLSDIMEMFTTPTYRGHIYDPKNGIIYVAIGHSGLTYPQADGSGTDSDTGGTDVIWYSPSSNGWRFKTRAVILNTSASSDDYYGSTKFTGNTEFIQFALVSDKHYFDTDSFAGDNEYSYLVALYPDGQQWPRVAPSIDDTFLYQFAIHRYMEPPKTSQCWSQARFYRWFDLTKFTISDDSSGISASLETGPFIRLEISNNSATATFSFTGAAATNASTGEVDGDFNPYGSFFGAGNEREDVLICRYLVMSIKGSDMPDNYDIWKNLAVELNRNDRDPDTDASVLYDGTATTYLPSGGVHLTSYQEPIIIPYNDGSGRYLIAFTIQDKAVLNQDYDEIRIRYVGAAAPASTVNVDIEFIGFSSGMPGNTVYGVTYFHGQSRAESAMTPCRRATPIRLEDMGGMKGEIRIPESSALLYNHRIHAPHFDATLYPTGTEYMLTYAKQIGGQWGMLTGVHQRLQQWSGSVWEAPTDTNGTAATAGIDDGRRRNYFPDNDPGAFVGVQRLRHVTLELITPRTPPSSLNEGIPPGSSLAVANQRLFVGQANMFRAFSSGDAPTGGSGINAGYTIAASRARCPFHFDPFPQFNADGSLDPYSPTVAYIDGDLVKSLHTFSAGVTGGDTVMVFSRNGLFAISGLDAFQISRPTKIMASGTLSPHSVSSDSRSMFWLDDDRQLRAFGEVSGVISSRSIANQLEAIPDAMLPYVTSMVYRNKLYVGIGEPSTTLDYTMVTEVTGAGTNNTRCLIFDIESGKWSAYRSNKYYWNGMGVITDPASGRLPLVFNPVNGASANTTAIYRIEDINETDDDGAAIVGRLRSKAFHRGFYDKIKLEDVTILSTQSEANFTVRWITNGWYAHTEETSARIPDSPGNRAWNRIRSASGEYASASIELYGTMISGEYIFGLWVDAYTTPGNHEGGN